jgi:hypothetical protein
MGEIRISTGKLLLVLGLLGSAAVAAQLPEIKRYLKIEQM